MKIKLMWFNIILFRPDVIQLKWMEDSKINVLGSYLFVPYHIIHSFDEINIY